MASRNRRNLAAAHPGEEFEAMLPSRASRYWTVVVGGSKTREAAEAEAKRARASGFAEDAFVLYLPEALHHYR